MMWCWRRVQISRTYPVKNEEELYGVRDKRDTVCTLKRRSSNWIGHILRRNRLLKHVTEGKIQGARRRRGRKQLLNDLQEKRSYRNLEQEAPPSHSLETRFGRGYGPVARQTT